MEKEEGRKNETIKERKKGGVRGRKNEEEGRIKEKEEVMNVKYERRMKRRMERKDTKG